MWTFRTLRTMPGITVCSLSLGTLRSHDLSSCIKKYSFKKRFGCEKTNWYIRQRPVDLYGGVTFSGRAKLFFLEKIERKLLFFFSTAAKLFFCEVSHVLYFLDGGLFKCKSITQLLIWFSTISTYAAQLFFLLILERNYFFW